LEDLNQVALEALVMALKRFDCERGTPFIGFARPTIVGSIKRHFRDQGWAIRVPRSVHQLAGPVRETADDLAGRLGRSATGSEVAEAMGLRESDIVGVQTAARARNTLSLDAPAPDGSDSPRDVPDHDAGFQRIDNRVALAAAIRRLDSRSRKVVGLYFFEELTQAQIAEQFGVSQMQVSRWLASALRRLRGWTGADADMDERFSDTA